MHRVLSLRHLTGSVYALRLERKGLPFKAGQFIALTDPRTGQKREYSVYSGENDDYLEVLVREVEAGKVSRRLKKLLPGDSIEVEGPFGFFRLDPALYPSGKMMFVATGTGISPFHSFARSYPATEFSLIHGVRMAEEAYDYPDYDRNQLVQCVTGEDSGDFHGRVTAFLASCDPEAETHFFLCGNSRMIDDAFDILTGRGIAVSQIHSEVYF